MRLSPQPEFAGRRPPALRLRSGGAQPPPRPVPARQALIHQAATFPLIVNRGWSHGNPRPADAARHRRGVIARLRSDAAGAIAYFAAQGVALKVLALVYSLRCGVFQIG